MSIKEDFDRAYDNLFYEAYNYHPNANPLPSVGKKRSTEGIRVKNQRAHNKIHSIDTRLSFMRLELEDTFKSLTEWRADYENVK